MTGYRLALEGSITRKVRMPMHYRKTEREAAQWARALLISVAESDDMHRANIAETLEFWTVDEIVSDLEACGVCDMLVCGGFYSLSIRRDAA